MPKGLRRTLVLVDFAMLAYWALALAAALGLIVLPASAMYNGYGTPIIDAWNWSFAPLDVVFSALGLWSVRLARACDPRWRDWAIVSLTLTGCAGLMAVSFWSFRGEFDLSWWIPNLILLAIPLFWIPHLAGGDKL